LKAVPPPRRIKNQLVLEDNIINWIYVGFYHPLQQLNHNNNGQ